MNLQSLLVCIGLTVTSVGTGQDNRGSAGTGAQAPKAPSGSPGLLNEWLRQQSPAWRVWDFGGQFRVRYEIKENAGSFPNRDFIDDRSDNDNHYLLLREKVHVGYRPVSWFSVFVEGRDSSSTGDQRHPNPEADQFDLQQAFVVLGDPAKFPLTLKVGRQEMLYGDERFIGLSDWSNVGRVFDLAKVRYQDDRLWVDVFSGRVVLNRDGYFNVANDYDWFSGIYAGSRQLIPVQETELFFLARNVGAQSPAALTATSGGPRPRDVYTLGVRVKSLPGKLGPWDYSAELAGQRGSANPDGIRRDLQSYLFDASLGYSWTNVPSGPRISLGYTYGSGDSDPTDNTLETFEPLFGTQHRLYGIMDLWGARNLSSPRLMASAKPTKKLVLATEFHLVWLADDNDFFYPESGAGRSANGYGRHPEFSRFIGTELDITAAYSLTRYADVQIGYGHFFPGDHIRQSVDSVAANRGVTGADWFFAQARINF